METGVEAGSGGVYNAFFLPHCTALCPRTLGGLCSRRYRRSYAHGRPLFLRSSPPAKAAAAARQTSERNSMGL